MRILRWIFLLVRRASRTIPLLQGLSSQTKRRVAHRFFDPIIPFFARASAPIELGGLHFYIPRSLFCTYVLAEYEAEARQVIQRALQPGMVVVDVGANIGYFTLLAASIVGDRGKVYAVEPGPDNLEYLHKNIQFNGFANVEVLPYAVGARRSLRDFHLGQVSTTHSFYPLPSVKATGTIQVQEVPLDEVIDGQVDFIKIDVEGEEIEALKGMTRILESNPDVRLLVEWSPKLLQRAGRSLEELPWVLQEAGFALTVIDDRILFRQSVEEIISSVQANKLGISWVVNLYAERVAPHQMV